MMADIGSVSQQARMLVELSKKSMELAVLMVRFVLAREAGCACEVQAGEHMVDDDGNLYLTVIAVERECAEHWARSIDRDTWSSETYFRNVLNASDEGIGIYEVPSDRLPALQPRLRPVDMRNPASIDPCMM